MMADSTASSSTGETIPKDIDNPKEEEKKYDTDSKKWVRKRTLQNVDYRSRDGSSEVVSPCFWDNKCNICEETFFMKRERDRHIREVHSKDERIKCPECDMTFSRKESMTRHRDTKHSSSSSMFKCEICHKSFTQQGNLDRHRDEVHAGYHFKCSECPASYARKEKLQAHKEKGNHLVEFYCDICKEYLVFKDLTSLEKHVKIKYGSRREKYGIKLWCTSRPIGTPGTQHIYNSKGIEVEKEDFIKTGLMKAQEDN